MLGAKMQVQQENTGTRKSIYAINGIKNVVLSHLSTKSRALLPTYELIQDSLSSSEDE